MIRLRRLPLVGMGLLTLGLATALPLWTLAARAPHSPAPTSTLASPRAGGLASGAATVTAPAVGDAGSVYLPGPIIKQDLALDCESAALEVALAVKGIAVTQDQIFAGLPQDSRPPVLGADGLPQRWGDPYVDFVGDVNGYEPSFTGYGVYYPPIVAAATRLGARADGHLGWTVDAIVAQLRQGNSVVVWLDSDFKAHVPRHWTAWDGVSIPYVVGEHAVPVIGYDHVLQTVAVVDVLYGVERTLSVQELTAALTTFGGMGIAIAKA